MIAERLSLSQLNGLDRSAFVSKIGWVYEHSPWVAEQAWELRPFATIEDLHSAMEHMVELAPTEKKLALILAHPDLAGGLAKADELTDASRREQRGAGLNQLSPAEAEQMRHNNARYREKFGFPFILCARLNNTGTILDAFARRLENSRTQEIVVALEEISKIGRLRLEGAIS
jgi:2-oxo-4-hydroxy-4-carboxy-5-ureidoimidazoline decarboxylase